MNTRPGNRNRERSLTCVLGVLALACAAAAQDTQAASPAVPRPHATVALVSDACPAVHSGDSIAFEWQPGFDPEWPVTALSMVSLKFARASDDGITVYPRQSYEFGRRHSHVAVTPLPNGFYHVEVTVPSERLPLGVYRLVDASTGVTLDPSYRGPHPQMITSPVESRYCITVVSMRHR